MPILEYENGETVYYGPDWQPDYPCSVLPPVIGDAVQEVSTNFKWPVELVAHAALSALSLSCHQFVNVQCPNFDPAPCSLFLLAVSNSSGGKSEVTRRFLRAVKAFEDKQKEDVAARMPDYQAELKIWRDDERLLVKNYRAAAPGSDDARRIREERLQHEKNRPAQPAARDLMYAELTPQALRDLLVVNGALGILSAEASPAMNGVTFSQPAVLSDYWSGEDRAVGLVSGSRRPAEPRLTISVMLQEDKFSKYMGSRGDDAFGTGLLARFLVAAPKSVDNPGDEVSVADVPEPKLKLFNDRVEDILKRAVPAPSDRTVLKLSEPARLYWKVFKEEINRKLICGDFSDSIKSFFRKLAQLTSRVAALFHYFEGKDGDISPEAMKSAIALCEWYTFEYVRVLEPYAPSQRQQDDVAAKELLTWLEDTRTGSKSYRGLQVGRYPSRDLNNYSPIRNNPELLDRVVASLERAGKVYVLRGPKGGNVIFYPPSSAANQQYNPNGVSSSSAQGRGSRQRDVPDAANQFPVPGSPPAGQSERQYLPNSHGHPQPAPNVQQHGKNDDATTANTAEQQGSTSEKSNTSEPRIGELQKVRQLNAETALKAFTE